MSKLFNQSGQITFASFISPYTADRDFVRDIHEKNGLKFFEGHVAASLEVCESRDVKGLYKKAREGIIPCFTGISDPYEAPANPELLLKTGDEEIEATVN